MYFDGVNLNIRPRPRAAIVGGEGAAVAGEGGGRGRGRRRALKRKGSRLTPKLLHNYSLDVTGHIRVPYTTEQLRYRCQHCGSQLTEPTRYPETPITSSISCLCGMKIVRI